ncbi:MAG: hypothetical protein ACUVX8_19160, partial [Candidatus Zipacnadales bacterium]
AMTGRGVIARARSARSNPQGARLLRRLRRLAMTAWGLLRFARNDARDGCRVHQHKIEPNQIRPSLDIPAHCTLYFA